jgi:hypothetical protein
MLVIAVWSEAIWGLANDAWDEADVGEDGGQLAQSYIGADIDLEINEVVVGVDFVTDLREAIHLPMEFPEHGFRAQTFGIDFEFDHDTDVLARSP